MDQKGRIEDLKKHNPLYVSLFERIYAKKACKAHAIKGFCLECMGFEDGVADAIRNCNASSCPLWGHRPYQVKQVKKTETD